MRLNWLRPPPVGRLSISFAVMLVPIRLEVASTSGASAVTVSVSVTPASAIVTGMVSSSPT